MYNDIVMIILCVFAVYGVYSVIREIVMLLTKRNNFILAIKVDSKTVNEDIVLAEQYLEENSVLNKKPVLLCDTEMAEEIKKYGYEVFVKLTEE